MQGRAGAAGAADGDTGGWSPAVCKVHGCGAVLEVMGPFFKRVRVCEEHAKAPFVLDAGGNALRFCQQCSRLEPLSVFDGSMRSCRVSLEKRRERRSTTGHMCKRVKVLPTEAPPAGLPVQQARPSTPGPQGCGAAAMHLPAARAGRPSQPIQPAAPAVPAVREQEVVVVEQRLPTGTAASQPASQPSSPQDPADGLLAYAARVLEKRQLEEQQQAPAAPVAAVTSAAQLPPAAPVPVLEQGSEALSQAPAEQLVDDSCSVQLEHWDLDMLVRLVQELERAKRHKAECQPAPEAIPSPPAATPAIPAPPAATPAIPVPPVVTPAIPAPRANSGASTATAAWEAQQVLEQLACGEAQQLQQQLAGGQAQQLLEQLSGAADPLASSRLNLLTQAMLVLAAAPQLPAGMPAAAAPQPLAGMPAAAAPPPLAGMPAAAAPQPLAGMPAAAAPPPLAGMPAAAAPPPLAGMPAAAAPPPLAGMPAAAAPQPLAGMPAAAAPQPQAGMPAAAAPPPLAGMPAAAAPPPLAGMLTAASPQPLVAEPHVPASQPAVPPWAPAQQLDDRSPGVPVVDPDALALYQLVQDVAGAKQLGPAAVPTQPARSGSSGALAAHHRSAFTSVCPAQPTAPWNNSGASIADLCSALTFF